MTYNLDLQGLLSLWLGSVNVSVCVYWNRKSSLGKAVDSNSVRSRHTCVCWRVLMNMPTLQHTTEQCEKKLPGISVAHKSPHMCFYLCPISSVFMTVIDMLINMFIA